MSLHPYLSICTVFVTKIYFISTRYDHHFLRQQFYLGNLVRKTVVCHESNNLIYKVSAKVS